MTDRPTRAHTGTVMTTAEVIAWLDIGRRSLTTQINEGKIPVSRIGGELRFWRPLLMQRIFGRDDPIEAGPEVITPTELASRLQLTPETVRSRLADGSIPASRIGVQWRIWWPEIRATLEAGEDFAPPVPKDES